VTTWQPDCWKDGRGVGEKACTTDRQATYQSSVNNLEAVDLQRVLLVIELLAIAGKPSVRGEFLAD
jgi:hypothetical protein